MKIHFYLRYSTTFGENLFVVLDVKKGNATSAVEYPLEYLNHEFWHAEVDCDDALPHQYRYEWRNSAGEKKSDGETGRTLSFLSSFSGKNDSLQVIDAWNPPGAVENVFFTQPFQTVFFNHAAEKAKTPSRFTHVFRVKAPLLNPDEVVCLLGHGVALRGWDTKAPLLLKQEGQWWTAWADLSVEDFPLAYKYGVWNTRTHTFEGFENGDNRALYLAAPPSDVQAKSAVVLHDGFARFPLRTWRGAGVAIPVFSLRSENSFGVGEFTDLPLLADWAHAAGLKLIQLLPINDTSATGAWTDSYPYAAISAFALHPLFLNVAEVAGTKHAAIWSPFLAKQKELNSRDAVDYEAVMQAKWTIIRQLYAAQKAAFLTDPAFIQYFTENKHWLIPYAAFCYLRDKNGGPDFNQWPENGTYREKEIEKLVSPKAPHYDAVAIHYFVQWHLHRQLKAAADYVHARGLALKGDIPIGIYRFSCDAWVSPELYNMDMQAGAPPDDFAVSGQNWGFPTYNWARMQTDGFSWWRQRFQQMGLYFDAFRIDHILGFFRIWSIPMHAVEGILGYFVPALPLTEAEFHEAGIGFDFERLCQPFINDAILRETFGEQADLVRQYFLEPAPGGGRMNGSSQYQFKPEFDTQRKVEAYLATPPPPPAGKEAKSRKKTKPTESQEFTTDQTFHSFAGGDRLERGLYSLHANVILLDVTPAGASERHFAFRIGIENTPSFQYLPEVVKAPVNALYIDYFFRRQDTFWQHQAMEKLPALKRATNMLICGEDLGMVPHCVPDVMQDLGILSLEIQRMPKKTGSAFFHPKDAPYLSVVTPSTHDMSIVRGWWEEDRPLIQRFFNGVLGYEGTAPYFCEHWVNRLIVEQHLQSPAMWAIFQLQDLLGMDAALRRENPNDERINIPANPKHYWRYRMHLTLEALQKADDYNKNLLGMVRGSGRY